MRLEELLQTYGYPIIALGTFLEGEVVLLTAAILARVNQLGLGGVVAAAFAGVFAWDQACYHVGRWKGMAFVRRRPAWAARADRVAAVLHRHPLASVVSFRFLYGMRTIAPLVIGASGFPPVRFLVLDIVAAALWAASYGLAGFYLGQLVLLLVEDIERYGRWLAPAFAVLLALVLWWRWRRRG